MKFFDFFKNKDQLEEELKGLENAQKILDERFEKKQITPDTYKNKSLEFRVRREKIESKLNK